MKIKSRLCINDIDTDQLMHNIFLSYKFQSHLLKTNNAEKLLEPNLSVNRRYLEFLFDLDYEYSWKLSSYLYAEYFLDFIETDVNSSTIDFECFTHLLILVRN